MNNIRCTTLFFLVHHHQRVDEHKRSTIGYHVKDEHGGDPDSIGSNFEILKKCQNKLDCLIFEMLHTITVIFNNKHKIITLARDCNDYHLFSLGNSLWFEYQFI